MLTNLSKNDFEKLLATLDKNREQAAGKYLALREKLERFFEWRGFDNTEELTDTVFDRMVKKISAGEIVENAEAYGLAVAKFVLLEAQRENFKTTELEENSGKTILAENDFDKLKQMRLKCLDKCLHELPEEKRRLLIDYFDTDEKTLIPKRKSIAENIGVNLNTLRIRISRLKSKVEKCMKKCCGEK